MAPNNNRCKWSSIFMLLLSLSLAVSVAVATDKAPLVEDGTLSLTSVFLFSFRYLCDSSFLHRLWVSKE